jgi:hypothetical protein
MAIPFLSKNSQINLCVKYIAEKYIINKQLKYWLGDARFREGSEGRRFFFISCFPTVWSAATWRRVLYLLLSSLLLNASCSPVTA